MELNFFSFFFSVRKMFQREEYLEINSNPSLLLPSSSSFSSSSLKVRKNEEKRYFLIALNLFLIFLGLLYFYNLNNQLTSKLKLSSELEDQLNERNEELSQSLKHNKLIYYLQNNNMKVRNKLKLMNNKME